MLRVDTLYKGVKLIDKRKLFAALLPMLIVSATAFVMTVTFGYAVTPAVAYTPTQNVTLMINDFMPAFFQIMIVMIFVLLLLVLVDRVAKHI